MNSRPSIEVEDTDFGPDTVDRMVEVADMMTVLAAERLMAVAVLHAEARERGPRMSAEILDRSVRLEIASELRITEYAAGELLALADGVVHRYPAVYDVLHRAEMTEKHAQILITAVDSVDPPLRAQVLDEGMTLATELPVGSFRRAMRALVDRVRAVSLVERHSQAVAGRRVYIEPVDDAMSWLHALIPSVEAHAIQQRLTGIAGAIVGRRSESESGSGADSDVAADDTRTTDQVRADALSDLLIDGDTTLLPDAARGVRASVVVTVPVMSLLGSDAPTEPATVEGVGPIPIDRARELCGGADGWMRVLTHPETGMVLSVSRDRYSPPPSLRKLVKWRSARCMAPGCGVPASRCQIDHTLAWEHGGETSLWNSAPLCQGHHTIKHHGSWVVQQIDGSGGAIEWTSPSGRRYVVKPERPMPAFRPSDEPPPF
ncbi:hypothetical protein GCM10009775_36590 [Microbacterium aoyamense]|uniref:HNH nuclease domain-containing protein n=1 Tax=Microbacterium aoyamense TaxID=344166 RepID=A0ABN2Q1T3_9MICO|nr:HNH endonuclease signature motif containing protein [Microbacterium aoyamense]